ncbi:hypothetical protein EsH8_II_001083 [Colletotrichum jinshuiense]
MATPTALRLEMATLDDVPALTELWFAAFKDDAGIRRLWPDTPGVRKWWDDANRSDILNKPFQRYVKVIDPGSADAGGRARIAAYAKWDLSMPEGRGRRYPPWHGDMPGQLCDVFMQREEDERRRVMGDQKHYYLDTLVTHPDYQRRGAGSMLLEWGCSVADENGVGAYVDASKAGAPLYQRFGFVDESEPDAGEVASMARRKRV